MTSLGFNPENVTPAITPIMTLLVQANTPLTSQDLRNTLGTLEIIESFDIARDIVIDHVTPETVELKVRGPVVTGTGRKYRKDKNFARYWNDIHEEITDCLYTHFTRTVELSTGTKESTHPMIRRIMKLLITPVITEFAKHSPAQILAVLDGKHEGMEGQDIFGHMSRFMACGKVETHSDNIHVARKLLSTKCSSNMPKLNRILLIQDIADKVQAKKEEEDAA